VSERSRGWDGDAVLARLSLDGDESVLDAGCGSGRVTKHLLDAVPSGKVIAVDADPDMVRAAAATLAGSSAIVRQVDLLQLDVPALDAGVDAVDAVFSTATFHWIQDHDALFARLFAALADGGRIEAQCGGGNNIARVQAVARDVARNEQYADDLYDVEGVANFATPEETETRLRAAGFTDVRCWLEEVPVTPDDPIDYLRKTILGPHVERLGDDLGMAFVHDVAEGLGYPGNVTIDYVRLNISGRRP
jgi:trans-aconitate 2-methyltransferase